MPLREQFFEDQLLRLTPPNGLNDPFDAKPTIEAIRRKVAFMVDQYGEGAGYLSDTELLSHRDTVEYLEDELNKYGIISLTEDPHNLLMWSHYADEHRGIVVGYDRLEDMMVVSSECMSEYSPATSFPVPVKYSRKRPDYQIADEHIYEIGEKAFFQQIALVKADDWIYEKEHRVLLPLSEADVAILSSNSPDVVPILNGLGVDFMQTEDTKFKFERGDINNLLCPVTIALLNPIINQLGDVMVFKRPKHFSMSSIIFGCKVKDEQICKALEKYRESSTYNPNVRLYKAAQSRVRFDLDFEEFFE